MSNTAMTRTADFLGTLGVQTHVAYLDGGYANLANVASDLAFLGIKHVRDGISDGPNGAAPLSSYIALARQGTTFTICAVDASVTDTASLNARLALIQRLVTAVPGSVTSIEGANEINNWPVTFNGLSGLDGAVALQKALYTAVHANPALAGIPVDYFTGYGMGGLGLGPDPTSTPGLADADTQHPYPNRGEAPAHWVSPAVATPNEAGSKGPIVYTETGYSSNGGTAGAVSLAVQAKYTLDLLLDTMKDGVSETDLYELMDAYASGSPQGNAGYGLFNTDNSPKPVAAAIHNLTAILADSGANAATFQTTPFAPLVTGLPSTGQDLVLEKSSGVYDLVVWAEPKLWDQTTGTEVAAPTQMVTIDLGAIHSSVKIFDPLVAAASIRTMSDARTIQVALTDHPLILEIGAVTPAPTVAIGAQILASDTGASATDNVTNNGAVTLSGTMTGATGTQVTIVDGASALGVAKLAGDGTWRFATTLTAGQHRLGAVATDPDGRSATSQLGAALTIITAPPAITLSAASMGGADGQTATLTGTVSGASGTSVTVANGTTPLGPATLDGKGGWSFSSRLAPGSYHLTATATDAAGNTASVDPAVTIPDPAPDRLVLTLSEDAYKGDAAFAVTVDGKAVGSVQTVTASHAAGQGQDFTFAGSFGGGAHTIGITYINDLWGGSTAADRNLYVNAVSLNGAKTTEQAIQNQQGLATYRVGIATNPTDTLTLRVSEDAYRGDAQFAVSIDGERVGGVQTVTASHKAGQSQTVTLSGNFGTGAHVVGIDFLNDLWSGSAAADRNLYVSTITYDGVATAPGATQGNGGLATYKVAAKVDQPDLLQVRLSEDAFKGDAQFTVSVDGQQVGGVQTVTASHAEHASQTFALTGLFGTGTHSVDVNFLNDAYAGSSAADRNLYVDSITLNGATTTENAAQLLQGLASYTVHTPAQASTPSPVKALAVAPGTTLVLDNTAAASAVTFTGSTAALQFTDATTFHGSVAGFGAGDTMDFRNFTFGPTHLSYAGSGSGGTLTLGDATHHAGIALAGAYTASSFALASDGHGGTLITAAR